MTPTLPNTPHSTSPQHNELRAPDTPLWSIRSLLNTKSQDSLPSWATSRPLNVREPPATTGKQPLSGLDNENELKISTNMTNPPCIEQRDSADDPQHLAIQHQHLPTPVSPAAPGPAPETAEMCHSSSEMRQSREPQGPGPSQTAPCDNDNNNSNLQDECQDDRYFYPIAIAPKTNAPQPKGIYTSFALKQGPDSASSCSSSSPSASCAMVTSSSAKNTRPLSKSAKPFACTECDQSFSRAHNLKSHRATHSTLRPYKCDLCPSKFRRLHDLKRHQKLHTGERPYVCSGCQRSFSRLDALNRHQRTEGGSACHHRQNKRKAEQQQKNPNSKNAQPSAATETASDAAADVATLPYSTPETLTRHNASSSTKPVIPELDLSHQSLSFPTPQHDHPIILPPPPSLPPPFPPYALPRLSPERRPSDEHLEYDALKRAYDDLSKRYKELENIIAQQYQQKLADYEQQLHDLNVENRVLRSLVFERQSRESSERTSLSMSPASIA